MRYLMTNAVIVSPNAVIDNGWLLTEDDRIAAIGDGPLPQIDQHDQIIDVQGDMLMPGLIDLHCDAIEKLVEPRPNVKIALPVAFLEADWRLAGAGITTEFHAISLDDNEFGVRSPSFLSDVLAIIEQTPSALIRHKVHARWEVTSERAFNLVLEFIAAGQISMVSLMDHTPGQGQYQSVELYRDYVMQITGRDVADIDALLEHKSRQMHAVPERMQRVTATARSANLALATHDDDTVERVDQWPAMGITVSEFPTTLVAATRAREHGLAVCMGAPNVLRGVSSGGNLSALAALEAGVVDILCSDYYPAAMLQSVFKVVNLGICALPAAVNLVTLNPARAVGLSDYGTLDVGNVADIVQVSVPTSGTPQVQRLLVDGRERLVRS